jgi:hypothetical protein
MEPAIPDGNHEFGIPDSKGAGEVDGIGSPQSVIPCQLACASFNIPSQFSRACGSPVFFPSALCRSEFACLYRVIPRCCGKR